MDGVNVRRLKIKGGLADEERLDLEEIKSMVARNRAHLGDQLKERGRMGAAVIEYRRALAENPNSVPILNKLSSVLIGLDREKEALELLGPGQGSITGSSHGLYHSGQDLFEAKGFQVGDGILSDRPSRSIPSIRRSHLGLAEAYEMSGR